LTFLHVIHEQLRAVQGLRGVAILAVVINHLNPNFLPGGYLGVDAFFVISGFVISNALVKAIDTVGQRGQSLFDKDVVKELLIHFYVRRIKRLFPALFVMVGLVTLVTYLLVEEFSTSVALTGTASLVAMSNIFQIIISNDYFGLASKLNVFTHTWSLGVEEQFYVVFPLLLLVLVRRNVGLLGVFFGLSCLSLALFWIFYIESKDLLLYYFPLSRFWEILLGVLAYFASGSAAGTYMRFVQLPRRIEMYAGLILLVVCFISPPEMIFLTAPLTCVSMAIMLMSIRHRAFASLEVVPLLFIGKISYSMYLYHIPVIILTSIGSGIEHVFLTFGILLGVSWLSYVLIEEPFRRSSIIKPNLKSLSMALIVVIVMSGVGTMFGLKLEGKDTFSPSKITGFVPCSADGLANGKIAACTIGADEQRRIFFIGDSHSDALLPVMKRLSQVGQFQIIAASLGGLFTTQFDSTRHGDLAMRGRQVVEFLKREAKPRDTIVITNQLMTWFGATYNDQLDEHRLLLRDEVLSQKQAFSHHLDDIESFATIGVPIIITAPFPDFRVHSKICFKPLLAIKGGFLGRENDTRECTISRSEWDQRRRVVFDGLVELAESNKSISIFDPTDLICDLKQCSSYKGGQPMYYDDDHINFNMAERIEAALQPLLAK